MVLFSTGNTAPHRGRADADALQEIRARMSELADLCEGPAAKKLALRIQYAPDVQALWFMRSELMARLARIDGEAAAREKMAVLGDAFGSLLPEGLRSRPSPLDSSHKDEGDRNPARS